MKVVITRPKERAEYFKKLLENSGFEPIIFPTLELKYNEDIEVDIKGYDGVIFTSPSGVRGLYKIVKNRDALKDKIVAVIGEKTGKEVEKYFNKKPDIMPNTYTAEALLEELRKYKNLKFLIPTTPATRDVLKNNLNADLIYVYQSIEPEGLKERVEQLKEILKNEKFILTFTSSLTAKNFLKYVDNEFRELIKKNYIVAIGPITAKTIEEFGFKALIPKKYTIEGMLEVIKNVRL
ncbi:uroporphyrinogen-III synthase [Methanocaldococcus villosus]|uniref:uroporphyrinogen-III synthase n=1 Tax=Methanocaldococcus villosus TaxID=667126 RepID=UPI000372BA9E|nr:uroporphyrinogen-III synthase [Methanocaldococcus villosus]